MEPQPSHVGIEINHKNSLARQQSHRTLSLLSTQNRQANNIRRRKNRKQSLRFLSWKGNQDCKNQIIQLLVYDGICTGTIYCELFTTEEEEDQRSKKFLCIHRIDFKIFKEHEMIINLSLLKNGEELYQKDVQLQKT